MSYEAKLYAGQLLAAYQQLRRSFVLLADLESAKRPGLGMWLPR
jgi:hypothetical protein